MTKSLLILGATGSIAASTFQLVNQHPNQFKVATLVARGNNILKLAQLSVKYSVDKVVISDSKKKKMLVQYIQDLSQSSQNITVCSGDEQIIEASSQYHDIVIAAITGIAGLRPIISSLSNCKILALANKESIVCAGPLLLNKAKKYGVKIIPIDSEHNALFNILGKSLVVPDRVNQLILTASGGPLWSLSMKEMHSASIQRVLKHPTWSMGKKISVDSASMMNKGLELIEASYLFSIDTEKIKVVVHPQSLIHAMVNYSDGTTMMHMGPADMRTSIACALFCIDSTYKNNNLDLTKIQKLKFYPVNHEKFPFLQLASSAFNNGPASLIAMNASNEVAVELFLQGKIEFGNIFSIVSSITLEHGRDFSYDLNSIEKIIECHHYNVRITDELVQRKYR